MAIEMTKTTVAVALLALTIPFGIIQSRRGVSESRVDGQMDSELHVDRAAAARRKVLAQLADLSHVDKAFGSSSSKPKQQDGVKFGSSLTQIRKDGSWTNKASSRDATILQSSTSQAAGPLNPSASSELVPQNPAATAAQGQDFPQQLPDQPQVPQGRNDVKKGKPFEVFVSQDDFLRGGQKFGMTFKYVRSAKKVEVKAMSELGALVGKVHKGDYWLTFTYTPVGAEKEVTLKGVAIKRLWESWEREIPMGLVKDWETEKPMGLLKDKADQSQGFKLTFQKGINKLF